MQKRDRKRYSREFKMEAVRRTQVTGKSVAEVARELEIPVHHLYKWRTEVDRKETEAFPNTGHSTPNEELEALRRENKRLREERDILKKSLIYFAKDASKDIGSSGNTNGNSE
ncbi:MAG: transposase [Elusimicrobiota bacterium]